MTIAAPALRVELLGLDDPWDERLLPVAHDVYHTAGFHRYAHGSGEGRPHLVIVSDHRRGLIWPYLLRRVDEVPGLAGSDATDVNSTYGYPGPVAWGCRPGDPFLAAAWREIRAAWRDQGAVAAFTRFHPLLENATLLAGVEGPDGSDRSIEAIIAVGPTVSLDVTRGQDEVRAGYGRDLRREIDVARRTGLVTEVDESWTELGTFARLYRETMVRAGAADYYFFDEANLGRLRDALADHIHLLVTRKEGVVATAGLFTEYRGIVELYLVGSDERFSSISPSKVLVEDAIAWARARGNTVMHIGGGRGGRQDSLLWAKSRFSPRRHLYHTGRWILDAARYRELAATQAAMAPGSPGPAQSGYFPAYRAPTRAPSELSAAPPPGAPDVGPVLSIRPVGPDDLEALGALLAAIDGTYFQPHGMDLEGAREIVRLRGRDAYLIGFLGTVPVGYGMLRGWDEGYRTPSLGIGIHRAFEHRGYGRAMMRALHEVARAKGATQVRLRVHPENRRAAALYVALGYRVIGVERGETLMVVDL